MVERYMLAFFDEESRLLGAVRDLRASGVEPLDVFTPYPVHGLDYAMGMRRTRLGIVCAVAGLIGAGSIFFFQWWTSAVDWNLNVGGKPFFSLPAFIPVTFEVGVLLAALGTVAAFLVRSRLYPGKVPELIHPTITDDRFVILLEERDAAFDRDRVRELCMRNEAVAVEERPKAPEVGA
ncbi:MAG: DUF3341 domain-containing protein [Thermoanaerobaculia bacterium]